MTYQTETENDKTFTIGHIFNRECMKKMTGTNWISSSNNTVTIERIEARILKDGTEWVDIHYIWPPTEYSRGFHNKDHFSFQCRYFLLIDDKTPEFVKSELQ
jgi:hypothetical protein